MNHGFHDQSHVAHNYPAFINQLGQSSKSCTPQPMQWFSPSGIHQPAEPVIKLLHPTGYAVVQGPRTSMVRPHPAVWRLVHGVLVVYVLFLVWMLFQNVHDARQFLKVRSTWQPQLSQTNVVLAGISTASRALPIHAARAVILAREVML